MTSEGVISLCEHCKSEYVAHLLPLLSSTKHTKEFKVQPVETYLAPFNK